MIYLARCHTNVFIRVFLSQATGYCHVPQLNRVPTIRKENEINTRTIITGEATKRIIHSTLRQYLLSAADEFQRNEPVMLIIRQQRTVETIDVDDRLPEK